MKTIEEWVARTADADGVFFDYGGVLTFPAGDAWTIFPFCEKLGLSRAALSAGFRKYRNLMDGDFITCDEMYERIFADNGLPPPQDRAGLFDAEFSVWTRMNPRALDLMKAVRAAGKKTGILTNMSSSFFNRFFVKCAAAYRPLADVEIVSGLHRLYKPERPIFDLASGKIGIPPARLVFWDDTPANVEAARSFGWQSEVFDGV